MSMFSLHNDDDCRGEDRSMFGPKPGTWSLFSETDPRFNIQGRCPVGGFVMPEEAKKALTQKEKELGCKAPSDLEFSYFKD